MGDADFQAGIEGTGPQTCNLVRGSDGLRWDWRCGLIACQRGLLFTAHGAAATGCGDIGHLLEKHFDADGSGLQSGPVTGSAQERLVLIDELVLEDLHSAKKITVRLQDGLGRIVLGEFLVLLPIEVAAVALRIHVGQLEQALLARDAVSDLVFHSDIRLGVAHVCSGLEASLSSGKRLEEVGPIGALVDFPHRIKSRAQGLDRARHSRRQQLARERLFDNAVPLGLPSLVVAQLSLLLGDGRGRRGLDLRLRLSRSQRCGGLRLRLHLSAVPTDEKHKSDERRTNRDPKRV